MAYIFGGSTGETPESVARKRAIAAALMGGSRPRTFGEGLSALGEGIGARVLESRASRAEAAGRASASDLLSGLGLGGDAAAAPQAYASMADGSPDFDASSPELAQGIADTAASIGMDPVDLATIISYETGGTFDPVKAGPVTQYGQHKGLIQFGEPQAAQYGVDWSNPVGSQLGPEGAVAKYFKDNGYQPGMGLMDAYSIVNAGGPGRYGASDANNGGAPGTVRDKVQGMAGHYAKAQRLMAGLSGGAPSSATAMVDPRAGVAQSLLAANAMGTGAPIPDAPPDGGLGTFDIMGGQSPGMTDASDAAAGGAGALPMAPAAPMPSRLPASIPQPRVAQGPDTQQLLRILDHPWASDAQKAVAASLLKSRMAPTEYGFQKLDDGTIIRTDPTRGTVEPVYSGPGKAPDLETIYDDNGLEYKGRWNPATQSYDRVGGTKAPSGMTITTNPDGTMTMTQGGATKPPTEYQGKAGMQLVKATDVLPLLDELGPALTDFWSSTGGQVPLVGNYLKTDQYRRVERAGNQFLTSLLRLESGAAIGVKEQRDYGDTFLPRPGDDPQTIADKSRAREVAAAGIEANLSPEQIKTLALKVTGLKLPEYDENGFAIPSADAPATAPASTRDGRSVNPGGNLPPAFVEKFKDRSAATRIRVWNKLSPAARQAYEEGLIQ